MISDYRPLELRTALGYRVGEVEFELNANLKGKASVGHTELMAVSLLIAHVSARFSSHQTCLRLQRPLRPASRQNLSPHPPFYFALNYVSPSIFPSISLSLVSPLLFLFISPFPSFCIFTSTVYLSLFTALDGSYLMYIRSINESPFMIQASSISTTYTRATETQTSRA